MDEVLSKDELLREVRFLRNKVAHLEKAKKKRESELLVLRDSELRLRKIYNIANDAIFVIDPQENRIVDANPRACQMLKYSQEEFSGMPVKKIHPREMDLFLEFRDRILAGEVLRNDKLTCRTKDGQMIPAEVSAALLSLKGRQYMLAIVRDISKRKRAENALLERQTRLELLNNIATGISSSASVDQVIKGVVSKISGYFKAFRIAYSTIDDQGIAKIVYSKQPGAMRSMSGLTIDLKKAPEYLSALHKGELVIVEDVCQDSRLMPLCRDLAEGKASAILDIPVQHSDNLVGLLGFAFSAPRKWSDHEITTLKEVADYLSIAIKDSEIQMQRNEAELALRRSEKRYQTLAEVSPVGIFHCDFDSNCSYVNQQWCRITGIKFEDALDAGWMQALHPEDKDFVVREWLESTKTKTPFKVECRLLNSEGLPVWVLAQAVAEHDKSGKVVGYVGNIIDITERKRIEEALRESETHTRILIEAIPDMMFQLKKDGTYLDFIPSDECDPLVPSNQFLGKKISEIMPADIAEKAMSSIKCALETGKPQVIEYTLTQDDETRDYEARIVVNGVDRVLVIVRNITTRKKAEAALRESEEKYRTLVQNSNEAIFVVQSGKVRFFNARAMAVTGYSDNELKAMEYQKLIHRNDQSILSEQLQNSVFDKKASIPNCLRVLDKSGNTKWVELNVLLIIWSGNPGYLWFMSDITEQHRLQEELARVQRLETAGRVAGQIAHDFNNLLSPLSAYPFLIREELSDGHPALEMLDEMEDSANKIAEINQQLLALGRRGHYGMDALDLNELVHKILMSENLPGEITIKERFEPNLFLIKGGAAQLTRALVNLIRNAQETMQGRGTLTVETENTYLDSPLRGYQTIARGEYVKLSISDTGVGIRPEILDKIFDPFFTTKRMDRSRGSGLGLSVVHGIVEDHKAYVQVDTRVRKGTTFSIYFPVSRESEKEELFTDSDSMHGNERILVVDDDPVQRRVASQLLRRLGYRVRAIASGEKAVSHLQKQRYDLLIMDMVMDGIDGVEAYKRILEFQPTQKAIILSGYAMSNRVQTAIRLGAGSFVCKPVSQKILANAVRKELDKKIKKRKIKHPVTQLSSIEP